MKKNPNIDPNSWLLLETAARFEVVDWTFGHMVHVPAMKHLGHPNGRVNLKDLKPDYAGKLVDAGFRHLRRKPETTETPAETAAETVDETTETPEQAPPLKKRGRK